MTAVDVEREYLDAVIAEIAGAGHAVGDRGRVVDVSRLAVPAPAAKLLERAAFLARAEVMIEVGLGSGLSTLSICRGRLAAGPLAAGAVHVIDPGQRGLGNIGLHAIRRAGLAEIVMFHPEPAHAVLPRLLASDTRAGFAFIDGMHLFDFVMLELFYLDRMLEAGGVIAVHDMWMPALQHAVSFWLANRDYEAVTVPDGDGSLAAEPCDAVNRGCGDPAARPPWFRRHVEPFVSHSMLLLRKRGDDARRWDDWAGGVYSCR